MRVSARKVVSYDSLQVKIVEQRQDHHPLSVVRVCKKSVKSVVPYAPSRYSRQHRHPPVAQSVEREAYTFVVLGSSPSGRTNKVFLCANTNLVAQSASRACLFCVWKLYESKLSYTSSLAQVEREAYTFVVLGSSPSRRTVKMQPIPDLIKPLLHGLFLMLY